MTSQDHPPLQFDERTHTYRVGARVLDHYSAVADGLGLVSEFCKVEQNRDEGKAVHETIRLYTLGQLDEDGLSEGNRNALEGYKKFQRSFPELRPIKRLVEVPSYHHQYMYGTTPDLPMIDDKGRVYVIDLKTAQQKQKSWRLQTASQAAVVLQDLGKPAHTKVRRGCLMVTIWGPEYRIVWHDDPGDWSAWLAHLQAYRWQKANGYLKDAT